MWIQLITFLFAFCEMIMTFHYFIQIRKFFNKLNKTYEKKMIDTYGLKPTKDPTSNKEQLMMGYLANELANEDFL